MPGDKGDTGQVCPRWDIPHVTHPYLALRQEMGRCIGFRRLLGAGVAPEVPLQGCLAWRVVDLDEQDKMNVEG